MPFVKGHPNYKAVKPVEELVKQAKLISMTSDDLNNPSPSLNHDYSVELKKMSRADLETNCLSQYLMLIELQKEIKVLKQKN